jgi:hypothetical protein
MTMESKSLYTPKTNLSFDNSIYTTKEPATAGSLVLGDFSSGLLFNNTQ